jgi:phenylpropionate dioxygenase-like ring-hydroxylating dioxygenase large terminal subunit
VKAPADARINGTGPSALQGRLSSLSADLDRGRVPTWLFGDPDVYRLELERVFTRCWVFVGHVTEIPDRGDYVLRYVGEDQFILVRGEDDQIRLLLNNCLHRGSPVCRVDRGNASHFRCPYHAWVYSNAGSWVGAPQKQRAYKTIERRDWGLVQAPHVDTYQGLIFACLDRDAVPLREYLGDMCWYLDVCFGLNEQGMEVVGDPQRWRVPADWKSGAENFMADAYHVAHTHESTEEVGVFPGLSSAYESLFHVDFDNGHGAIANRRFLPEPWQTLDYPPDVASTFELDRLKPEQRAFLEHHGITVFTIFPNLSFIRVPGTPDPETHPPVVYTSLRQWQPKGPGMTELCSWLLQWKSAPAAFNDVSYRAGMGTFGSSGIFEQDDTVVWAGPPHVAHSPFAAREGMAYNYQQGLDGMSDYEYVDDFPGPGRVSTTIFGDVPQRAFFARWLREIATADR